MNDTPKSHSPAISSLHGLGTWNYDQMLKIKIRETDKVYSSLLCVCVCVCVRERDGLGEGAVGSRGWQNCTAAFIYLWVPARALARILTLTSISSDENTRLIYFLPLSSPNSPLLINCLLIFSFLPFPSSLMLSTPLPPLKIALPCSWTQCNGCFTPVCQLAPPQLGNHIRP